MVSFLIFLIKFLFLSVTWNLLWKKIDSPSRIKRHFERWMLKQPVLIPRSYISRSSKIGPKGGQKQVELIFGHFLHPPPPITKLGFLSWRYQTFYIIILCTSLYHFFLVSIHYLQCIHCLFHQTFEIFNRQLLEVI